MFLTKRKIKLVAKSPLLAYFDNQQKVTLEYDQTNMALVQPVFVTVDRLHPLANIDTNTECLCKFEREILANVCLLQRFHPLDNVRKATV